MQTLKPVDYLLFIDRIFTLQVDPCTEHISSVLIELLLNSKLAKMAQ